MKNLIPSVITAVLLFLLGILGAFMLLILLNGFSESDANLGLILYAVWVLLTILIFGAASGFATGFLIKKTEKVKPWITAAGMIIVFSTLGSISIGIAIFLGAALAEISRTSF